MPLSIGQYTITDLTDGINGTSSYTHIRYSAVATGNPMTPTATGALYMGIAVTSSATAPTGFASYAWSLIKGDKGDTGDNSISGVLSNDSHTIATDSAGNGGVFTNAVSTMSIYNGATDDSANWTVTVAVSNVSGTLSGKQYTVTGMTAGQDVGYVDFTATRSGYANIVKRFTLTKSKQGVKGTDGTTPTTYWLVTSVPAIAKSDTGVFTPSSITITGKSQTGTATPANYLGRFIIADSIDGTTFTTRYTSSVNEATKSYGTFTGIKALKVSFYLAGGTTTLLDEQIITIVSDGVKGDDGISSYTHIAYADNTTGLNFHLTDSNRLYVGLYSSSSATQSGSYTAYKWSLIKGTTGTKGDPGDDGLPIYFHTAYATNSTGTAGFHISDPVGKTYIGTYSDNTVADSTNPALYTWVLIKGADGADGANGELNLVSNPHVTGTVAGWTGGGVYATTPFTDGRTVGALNLTTTSDLMQQATIFDIEPQKMYEFSVWVKHSVTKSTNYFGLYGYNSAGANIGVYPISTATGVKTATLNTNPYFWSGTLTAGVWVKLTAYVIPAGYPTTDVELFKNIGEGGVTSIFQFPADARKASMRVLNYTNTVSTTLTMALPMVKEVDISVLDANKSHNMVSYWTKTGKVTIDGGKIEADSADIGVLKTGVMNADKISISNSKVTIDSTGVTVSDANFLVKDVVSGTKYSVDTKRNLVKDHSFEMIQDNGGFTTDGKLFTANSPQANSGIGWQVTGFPKIRPNFDVDGVNQWIMFGNKAVVVDYGNRFYQDIPVVPLVNYPYAISFYATTPIGMTAGIPKLNVEWWTGGALSSTQTFTFPIPSTTWGQKTRYSASVGVPNLLTNNTDSFMRIYVNTPTTSTFTEIDGVQVVEGTVPTTYNDEASLWEIATGQQIAEYVRIRSLEADTVSAMTKMFTTDMDVMGNLNLYSNSDASANSTSHAFTIGSNTSGVSLKMDTNEISAFNGSLVGELHVNPDGGRVVFNNNEGTGNVVIADGGIALTNAKQANTYNLGTIRDGTSVHSEHMMILNISVGVPTNNTAQAYADFTWPRAFSATPIWVLSAPESVSSTVYKSAIYSPTATGFRVYINHIHNSLFNGTIEVQVVACGKRT